jgi:Domain of unknown function (DUF4340)
MNENTKTISLIAVAAVVLLVAFVTSAKTNIPTKQTVVGTPVFPALDDPIKAKRMRIVTFDEDAGHAREFEVAQVNGVWSLPSHKNYPADAKQQMADAATALVDVKYLGEPVTDRKADHELYGVVEPKVDEDQFGQKGVGKLVIIEDEANKPLARVIIGKEDKSPKADDVMAPQTGLRFIRIPGQDQVYRVSLRADKFSSRFQDWMETDLLKLSPWDIQEVDLHDYSISEAVTPDGRPVAVINRRGDLELAFEDKDNKWTAKKMVEYKEKATNEKKLADDEELDSVKLNALKEALHSLKIMDIDRKPTQMSADLKADKSFFTDLQAKQSLAERGYYAKQVGPDQWEIYSNDGEAIVRMKDGVKYVLRFGEIAGIDNEEKSADASKGDKGKADTDASDEKSDGKKSDSKGSLSRYIMVMAEFDPDVIPKPELQAMPEIKKAPEKSESQSDKGSTKTGATGKADTKAGKADEKSAKAPKADSAKADAKSDSSKSTTAKSTDAKGDKADAKSAVVKDENEDIEAIEAEQHRVEKENRRKQDEYNDKVKKGQDRAKELNSRFADWYYVVDDQTYKKIHLGMADIIKKKAPKDAKSGATSPAANNPFDAEKSGG